MDREHRLEVVKCRHVQAQPISTRTNNQIPRIEIVDGMSIVLRPGDIG